MGACNFITFGKGKKWESRVIDCGATKGGHMWAFYGWASC